METGIQIIRKRNTEWSEAYWRELEADTRHLAVTADNDVATWRIITRRARYVMRSFTTSFYIVTRFLPPAKREQVEAVYAAVRYPDEIVDTFPVNQETKEKLLTDWALSYETALLTSSIQESLERQVPCFLASFAAVVRDTGIPPDYYRSFIEAMHHDVKPRRFVSLDDLIDSYIYGSAIVVGYFLAHIYGENQAGDFPSAIKASRDLGIALQLTNFLRDVSEDQRRGRLYLPLDILREEGIAEVDVNDRRQHPALNRVVKRLVTIAQQYYQRAEDNLDAFAPDCQVAIRACIDVYRQLNQRIAQNRRGILHRESVPAREKFKVLPASKYWRLPLAYLTESF
jgi:phytoene synthase